MLIVNKLIKVIVYFVVRLLSAISLAFLALLVTNPFLMLTLSILDALNKIPSFMQGRYLICWLIISAPFFVGFNIYTDIKMHKNRLKNNKQSSNNQ